MTSFELGLVLASAVLHAWWSVAIKDSGDPLAFNLLQEVAPAAAFAAILPFVDLAEVPASAWRWLALSSVVHGFYFYWMSRAYEHGDLTLVYPIARSTPAFLPFVAVPLFGESVSALGCLGIATVVAGIWCVQGDVDWRRALRSPATRFAWLTLATTVAYSLSDAGAMRSLASGPWTSPVPRALFYCLILSVGSALVFLPLAARHRSPRQLFRIALLPRATLAAGVSVAGYGLILHALESAPASYVVAARQTSVIFALVFGMAILHERPGRLRVIGALATALGVALIGLWGVPGG